MVLVKHGLVGTLVPCQIRGIGDDKLVFETGWVKEGVPLDSIGKFWVNIVTFYITGMCDPLQQVSLSNKGFDNMVGVAGDG